MSAKQATEDWSPSSWVSKKILQQPTYEDSATLEDALQRLSKLPPLVTSWEIHSLKDKLAEASRGEAFVLQGGDCSENLEECSSDAIVRNFKVLLQMSLVLAYGTKQQIVRIGRIAGQYAKPRSNDHETRGGVTLPSYRGDIVNRSGFTEIDRRPDPELLLRGYERSALTLNFLRALSVGGFADLHHPENWELDFAKDTPRGKQYHELLESITQTLTFMEKLTGSASVGSTGVEFYTSHEGLHLRYEQSQTRHVPGRTGWYNLSTHFPWIGNRTRQLDGAHIEYFRGIINPIGIKIDDKIEQDELLRLTDILNPENEPGRITLIHRIGATKVEEALPRLIEAIQQNGRSVLWMADPMHGNTFSAEGGRKTRDFEAILSELRVAFSIHKAHSSKLGGVHLELTGDNVTECVGGAGNLKESDLGRAYKTAVDPRLNYDQAMEIAFLIVDELKQSS